MSDEVRERVRRRLAAILVAGYGRLFPGDQAERLSGLTRVLTGIIQPLVADFGGNIFKSTGELVLVEFDSVVEAVRGAAALRDALAEMNRGLPNEQRIGMRIGINLGDIIVEAGDLFGDGVNVAARIEALAEPGSIYVSEIVHDQVVDKLDFQFEDLGPKELKNIRRPVRLYRMGGAAAEEDAAAAIASPPGFDDHRAIAVLPFANFSGDPEQEFFADGLTEDIISMLAGWRAFPVIARNSTFTYKGQTVDVKKVGQELGARYVLEGSVRKSGRRVRVTAQLIQADTGHHIIAERYDRDLTDLFDLQDEIVGTIAGAIEPELLKFERDRLADRPQHNADAYDLYQRGMWHHYRHNKQDNIEAQAFFRNALALDAQYPQATAALAIAVCNAAYLGWTADIEGNYTEAFELAQRAVTLDSRYPNAHFALGLVSMWTARAERAIAAFQEAIKLNPSFAAAHVLLGQMYLYGGRPEEAIATAEKGIRLSPSDPRLFIWLAALAGAHYQLRHYEEAVNIGRRAWALNRNWPAGLRYVVAGLGQLGRAEEAQSAVAELKSLDPGGLAFVEGILIRLYTGREGVDHFLDGLRKAGFA
ncbi:MAG TPA: adenylate/guanylate cyclase domain-containing protein [Stellaceae bacterium]|nr:adenylate/guanylate cyclase domain-containing protein [Stellaceae bacterium]